MIERRDVEPLLLKACPSVQANPDRLEWHKDWDDADEPPLYLLTADFVRHLTALNAAGDRRDFPAVFQVVEDLHRNGDPYVRELATVGILEDLQNTNLHPEGSKPDDFIGYLLPVSKWWWEEVELFWEGKVVPIGSSGRPRPDDMGLSSENTS
jgi:hypothetical protein